MTRERFDSLRSRVDYEWESDVPIEEIIANIPEEHQLVLAQIAKEFGVSLELYTQVVLLDRYLTEKEEV